MRVISGGHAKRDVVRTTVKGSQSSVLNSTNGMNDFFQTFHVIYLITQACVNKKAEQRGRAS